MEEVERLLAELQADVEALKTEPSDAWPKVGDFVYVVLSNGKIMEAVWMGTEDDNLVLKRGLIFRTRKEAEAEDKRSIALAGIHADAKADRERFAIQGHVRVIVNAGFTLLVPLCHVPYGTPYFHTYEAAAASAKKWLGGEE
ncbi:MAG: hypothetical protein JJ965_04195 [Alphaproteobacteria bacterium]|nr:hypothetical protein [Alphaproteobacteria bacterium]